MTTALEDPRAKTTAAATLWRARAASILAIAAHAISDRVECWYSDDTRISRPKILFSIVVLDLATIFACAAASLHGLSKETALDVAHSLEILAVAALTTALLHRSWSYTIHALRNATSQIAKVMASTTVAFCCASGVSYLTQTSFLAPAPAMAWLVSSALLLSIERIMAARLLRMLTAQGRLVRRTIIVGGGQEAESLLRALDEENHEEIKILGVFDDRFDDRSSDNVMGHKKLGKFDRLADFCRDNAVDLLIVTVPLAAENRLLQIMHHVLTLPVDVRISALGSKLRFSGAAYSYIGRIPMLALMDRPLTDWDRVAKNIVDRLLAGILIVLASPVMLAVALAVRLDSNGPIIFRQRRYGFNNDLVEVWKFRSLYVDRLDASASKLVTKGDPRVTRVGRFIRKSSLDELPQLFNVLRGEMALVGPRPHATEAKADKDLYQTVVDGYFARHRVKPGVTGWAQINGWRGETDTHEKIQRRVEADLYYIDNWSVLLDLYVLAMTPVALITGKNAY